MPPFYQRLVTAPLLIEKETDMRKTAATFFAIGAIAMAGVIAVLTPTAMTPEVVAATTASGSEPFVYFPAQYVNQAKEIEPAPPTF
jgi:hypothetical protein